MGKLLQIIGILPRSTQEWQRLYRMQSAMARHFSSTKHSRLLNRRQHRSLSKVSRGAAHEHTNAGTARR